MHNETTRPQFSVRTGSPFLAVTIGFIVDIGGSLILGVVYVFCYSIMLSSHGISFDQIRYNIVSIHTDPIASIPIYAIGCIISAVAGYVCARIVKYSEYKYTSILAVISSLFGFLIGSTANSLFKNVIILLFTYGSVMLGALIYLKDKNRAQVSVLGDKC
jgi:hypothetical protein